MLRKAPMWKKRITRRGVWEVRQALEACEWDDFMTFKNDLKTLCTMPEPRPKMFDFETPETREATRRMRELLDVQYPQIPVRVCITWDHREVSSVSELALEVEIGVPRMLTHCYIYGPP